MATDLDGLSAHRDCGADKIGELVELSQQNVQH
jgi:hypothetical protein